MESRRPPADAALHPERPRPGGAGRGAPRTFGSPDRPPMEPDDPRPDTPPRHAGGDPAADERPVRHAGGPWRRTRVRAAPLRTTGAPSVPGFG